MGTFRVPIRLRKWQDIFLPEPDRGADVLCDAYVDSGAAHLSLPTEIVERLELLEMGRVRVRTADGTPHEYRLLGMVQVEVQGRSCVVPVVELPAGAPSLLGALPLEEMDWHISPLQQKLLPNPESPDMPQVWLLDAMP